MQLQYGLVRIDGAKEARGTNPIEMTGLIVDKMSGRQRYVKYTSAELICGWMDGWFH